MPHRGLHGQAGGEEGGTPMILALLFALLAVPFLFLSAALAH